MQPRVGERWKFCGSKFPKEEIIYFCQVLMVYIVMITSIVNLCISDTNTCTWSSLVSGNFGNQLPNPPISKKKEIDVFSYDSTIEQQHEHVPKLYLKSLRHSLIESNRVGRRLGSFIIRNIISTHLVQYSRRWIYAEHYNAGQREGFYSDGYQLVDWCDRMIERNLKVAGTIVDTNFAYDATSRKISVHVGADNVITFVRIWLASWAFRLGSSPLEKKENTRERSLWTRTEDSIIYTSIAIRLKLYQWATLKLPFCAWSMQPEIVVIWFIDCILRLSTFQLRRKSLTLWK